MAIYMKIDGIDGHVTAKGYEKWIEVDSLNFGVSRNISTVPGNVTDRESTKPKVSEIIVSKQMCKASPNLFSEACVGKSKPNVKIHVCQTGGDSVSPYMEYTLSNVLLSNYQVNGIERAEKVPPTENVNLNFDKIEMKYTPYDDKHNPQSPIPAGYDLSTAKKV